MYLADGYACQPAYHKVRKSSVERSLPEGLYTSAHGHTYMLYHHTFARRCSYQSLDVVVGLIAALFMDHMSVEYSNV